MCASSDTWLCIGKGTSSILAASENDVRAKIKVIRVKCVTGVTILSDDIQLQRECCSADRMISTLAKSLKLVSCKNVLSKEKHTHTHIYIYYIIYILFIIKIDRVEMLAIID